VKFRGPASLIAEKYQQLARDAQTSGDLIAAEGYLQHAEHCNRLFAAAQEQFRQWVLALGGTLISNVLASHPTAHQDKLLLWDRGCRHGDDQ
jgi:hypothetical protein